MTTNPQHPTRERRETSEFQIAPTDYAAFALDEVMDPERQIRLSLMTVDPATLAPAILQLQREAKAFARVAAVHANGGSYADVVSALEREVERLGKEG